VEQANILSCEGHLIGNYIILCQKIGPPRTKHDVGEDIEFPGSFLEAELIGAKPLPLNDCFKLMVENTETRIRARSCNPLPENKGFFHIKIEAA